MQRKLPINNAKAKEKEAAKRRNIYDICSFAFLHLLDLVTK